MRDIEQLIPQRAPIRMVDKVESVEGDTIVTCLTIRPDLCFVDEDGVLAEAGLIEHIAQSASALAGHKAAENGAEQPPIGYLGEVKKFRCYRLPRVEEELRTCVTQEAETENVTMLSGETRVGGEPVASMQMKISLT